jgi:prepilin-type N-terminal cleavage/methylation domain-containing protein/prepilin-type processing-associated H-X9-DG protein
MDMVKKRKGFTLIELLIAIAVIGILMSLLIPAVNKVMESARRTKGANCLKQIATAYNQYCSDDVNGRNISEAASGLEWALILARGGYLNDPNMYTFSGDSTATKVVKKVIVDPDSKDNKAWGNSGPKEFSVYLINNIPVGAPLSTTPIAFTRGLPDVSNDKSGQSQKVAKWPGTGDVTGTYSDKGGYIAFLDGHVEWFDDLGPDDDNGKLMMWAKSGTTNDIRKAIPSTATILNAEKDVDSGTAES